jgi:23S rRNA pseudouridine1911/1915/1917 synthase
MTPIVVPPAAAGERLDRYLTGLGQHGSRSRVQRLIEAGRVRLNGKVVKAGFLLRAGDEVAVEVAEAEEESPATRPPPEDIPLAVLHEDQDLLVIDKPAGLVVHPAPGHWRGTLVGALLHRWQGGDPGLDLGRPGIVHRLDRDTSGVLVIGRTPETVALLSAEFKARRVEKEYLAVVWRCPRPRDGVIDRPIGRHPRQRKRMAVREGGRAAVTHYEVTEDFGDLAVVRLRPETGRTHQLRVHLAALGHPLLGDRVYGRVRNVADDLLRAFPRHALHAASLAFLHPRTGEAIRFEAPLPEDLGALLAHLRLRGKLPS